AAGPTQYSNSNTITGAVTGLTLNLTATGSSTVNVAQDTATATNNVNAFITAFNAAVDNIDSYTKIDPTTNKGSLLTGDGTIQDIESGLKSMLSSAALVPSGSAYKTLEDIGISTGAYGSTAGTTNHLVLDSSKLTSALLSNPSAVFSVLSGLTGTATLTDSSGAPLSTGTSWLQSISGFPTNQTVSGTYQISYNPSATGNNLTAVFKGGDSTPLNGKISSGGINVMVPGLTLTAKSAPAAGIEYVTTNVATAGVLQNANNYLTTLLQPGGIFDTESQGAATQTTQLQNQITSLNQMLQQRQQTLQAQFTQMEVSMSQLQQQGASLASKLSGN
ncbi:MAG: flagellar filament capping protein FliD, partial [Chloroflexi bacterium]|nr:flagellar filament capping protein FliD [Chloroflexota bacterium]